MNVSGSHSGKAVRSQKLQCCERALTEGIQKNSAEVLRWFTSEILHLERSWAPAVVTALLDKSKAGEYRWRTAQNPLGLVRTIAKRVALKSYPELVFGNDADKVLNPNGRAVSTLRPQSDGQTGTYADGDGEVLGTGYWHDEFIDKATYAAGDSYDEPQIWNEIDSSLIARKNDPTVFNWNKISQRIGLSKDQTKLLKARAVGITRAAMAEHLGWDSSKVERIWKAVQRLFDDPAMSDKVRQVLCSNSGL